MIKQLLSAVSAQIGHALLDRDKLVETDQLIHLIGLKRSGLHALSFWLLGHRERNLLINNSPVKRAGEGSPMSRTVRTSPLPVVLRRGDRVATCQNEQEVFVRTPKSVDLSIVLFQSQSLSYLNKAVAEDTLTAGLTAQKRQDVLMLRDPFNWAASYLKKSQSPSDYDVWPDLWKEYADEFVGKTQYFPSAVRVNYNLWFCDRSYRQKISTQLGLAFTDKTLEVVTAHAGGSSFDRTQFDARAQSMAVTERWRRFENDVAYRRAFEQRPDILELALSIFDLPPDLESFAKCCQQSAQVST